MNRDMPGTGATEGGMFALWSRYWWVLIVRGVVAFLLGVLAFMRPLATVAALVSVFGVVALADGSVAIAAAIAGRRLAADWSVRETRRQQAEATLRDGEERLRLALEAANEGIYDHNLQTGEAHVSPGYATMLGYDPAAFRETTDAWIERMHPDDREPVTAQYLRYLAGEIPDTGSSSASGRSPGTGAGSSRPGGSWSATRVGLLCACWAPTPTSPSAGGPQRSARSCRRSSSRPRRWSRSAGWRAAWRTTSTTC